MTVVAGVFPAKCEKCEGVGFWSTQPVEEPIEERRARKRPRVPYDLNLNDRRLLKQLRIAGD